MENKLITTSEKPVLLSLISSPDRFYKALSLTRISQALESKSPAIGTLLSVVKNGDTLVKSMIVTAITDLDLFLNVGKSFGVTQVAQTAELIIEDFKHLKMEDFKLFFLRMKKGFYGKLFDRLDGQIIIGHLHEYCHERALEAEQISFKAHSLHKSDKINIVEANPEGQKKVIEILSQYAKKNEFVVEKKVIEKTPKEKLIQRFFNQFYKIWLKTPHKELNENSGRFIKRYGGILDEVQYVEYKIQQFNKITKYNKP